MIKNYFKIAWRSIQKNKSTALINITGLSVGMTAAIFILLWVQNEMSFDDYHPDADRVYRLTTSIQQNDMVWESTPLLLADAAKKQVPEIEKTARLYADKWPVFTINNNLVYEKKTAYVDEDWFKIFHYDFIEGDASAFDQNPYSIILTAAAAKKYFSGHDAMGATIRIDSMLYQVKAIVADAPANSSFQYQAFLPVTALLTDAQLKANDENWDNFNYITFAKLKSNSSALATGKKLTALIPANDKSETSVSLLPLTDMHFESGLQSSVFARGNRTTVYIFTILAFLLLLIACINYVNLTTAKASLRAKEVSVRKMVGAKRTHLFYQFIAESLLISCIALITTLVLLNVCLASFNSFTGKSFALPLTSLAMWRIIGSTLLVALLLNSIYPALLLSSFKPLNVFRGFTILKVKDSYFRKGLVIVQFTVSVVLIACTIIIYRQMQFIQHSNPGYNRSQVLSFALPPAIDNNKKELLMQTIRQDLLGESSIQNITMANQPVINIGSMSTGSADWDGHATTYNPKIAQLSTDADFAKTMQLTMKEGRWFEQGNKTDVNNVVLNEIAVSMLNIHKPVIGQRFTFKGRTGQIVGVVQNFNYKSLHDKSGPLVAFNDPNWYRFFMVRAAAGNASQAVLAVQNAWKKFVPDSPLEYNFLDDAFNDLYKEDQQTSMLIFVFAMIAVVISSLGLFGLAAFTAAQRLKEIGIRKVLGATVTNITTLLSGEFVKLVGIAIFIALPVAFFVMNKWIQNFAYRIDIGWWMFAVAGLLVLMIALITVSFQAIKAAVMNPVKSLKNE